MTGLVVFTVIDIVLLIAGLAFYLFWAGSLLTRIAGNLEDCAGTVGTIVSHARLIRPGVEHINETGGVVAGALPLLYGMPRTSSPESPPRRSGPSFPSRPGRPQGPGARGCWRRSATVPTTDCRRAVKGGGTRLSRRLPA